MNALQIAKLVADTDMRNCAQEMLADRRSRFIRDLESLERRAAAGCWGEHAHIAACLRQARGGNDLSPADAAGIPQLGRLLMDWNRDSSLIRSQLPSNAPVPVASKILHASMARAVA